MKVIPAIPYAGGKARAVERIIASLPRDFTEYREIFIGGGSVAVNLMSIYPKRSFWINDLYRPTYCVWKNHHEHPQRMVQWILQKKDKYAGVNLWNYCKDGLKSADDFELGCMHLCILRMSRNGGGLRSGYQKGKTFSVPQILGIFDLSAILRSVDLRITSVDYSQCLGGWPRSGVAIFADPPYIIPRGIYGGTNGQLHNAFDHARFARDMRNCPHEWLITYNDDPDELNRRRFADFEFEPLLMHYSLNQTAQVVEWMITNYLKQKKAFAWIDEVQKKAH